MKKLLAMVVCAVAAFAFVAGNAFAEEAKKAEAKKELTKVTGKVAVEKDADGKTVKSIKIVGEKETVEVVLDNGAAIKKLEKWADKEVVAEGKLADGKLTVENAHPVAAKKADGAKKEEAKKEEAKK